MHRWSLCRIFLVVVETLAIEDLQLLQVSSEVVAESAKAAHFQAARGCGGVDCDPRTAAKPGAMLVQHMDEDGDVEDEEDTEPAMGFEEFLQAHRAAVDSSMKAFQQRANTDVAPLHVYPMPGEDYIKWDMCNATIHSNLGGQGPDIGAQELRYEKIVQVRDANGMVVDVDLSITALEPYEAKDTSQNGLVPDSCFGQVNVRSTRKGTGHAVLQFAWYVHRTTTPVDLSKQFFTMYDIDGTKKSYEAVTFWEDVHNAYVSNTSELKRSGDLASGLTLSAEGLTNNVAMPRDPDSLTEAQANRAVTVSYLHKSSFELTFSVAGGRGGRNFAFAGHNVLSEGGQEISGTPTPPPTRGRPVAAASQDEPSQTTCEEAGTCAIYEDPHIKVFDGMQISLLSSVAVTQRRLLTDYGAGDVWLVRSSSISIQGRYLPNPDIQEKNLFVRSVAIGGAFLNGNTLIIGPLEEDISWNGVPVLENQTSDFEAGVGAGMLRARRHMDSHLVQDISQRNAGVDVAMPLGVKLTVNRYKYHVNVFIDMPRAEGGQEGLCGNYNCRAADDTLDMILTHRSPKVLRGESLFPQ